MSIVRGRERVAPSPFPLRGELDMERAPECRVQLWAYAMTSEGDVVCDCTELEFLDSSGVAMFVEVNKELAERGRALHLTHVTGGPRRVLEVTGLLHQLT